MSKLRNCPKRKNSFTPWTLVQIWKWCSKRLEDDDLSLLIACQMVTKLSICSLLGWFNECSEKRLKFLQQLSDDSCKSHLIKYTESKDVLFTRSYKYYLKRCKVLCCELTGMCNASFEMIAKSMHDQSIVLESPERMIRPEKQDSSKDPPKTPEHFWELDFPDEEECIRRGYIEPTVESWIFKPLEYNKYGKYFPRKV